MLLDFLDQNCNSQTAVTDHCGLSSTLLTAEDTEINCFSIQGAKSPVVGKEKATITYVESRGNTAAPKRCARLGMSLGHWSRGTL